jgi:large-conductance mechanosensitive channel
LPGKGALDVKTFTLHFNDKVATFGYGAFVMTMLNFILVAAIVYFVFKGLKLDRLAKKKEEEPKEEAPKEAAKKSKGKSTKKK